MQGFTGTTNNFTLSFLSNIKNCVTKTEIDLVQ